MVKLILIPTDGSEHATTALASAVNLAADLKAKVVFLVVTEPFRVLSTEAAQVERVRAEYVQYERDRADRILERAKEVARQANVVSTGMQIDHNRAYEMIIETAQRCGADMIAMGSHGYGGVHALILGSVTQKVLTHCHLPVLVFR